MGTIKHPLGWLESGVLIALKHKLRSSPVYVLSSESAWIIKDLITTTTTKLIYLPKKRRSLSVWRQKPRYTWIGINGAWTTICVWMIGVWRECLLRYLKDYKHYPIKTYVVVPKILRTPFPKISHSDNLSITTHACALYANDLLESHVRNTRPVCASCLIRCFFRCEILANV